VIETKAVLVAVLAPLVRVVLLKVVIALLEMAEPPVLV
jgi:hypothetical protein